MLNTVLMSSNDLRKAFLVMIHGECIRDAFRIQTLHAVTVYYYRPSAVEMTPWDTIPYAAFDMDVFPPGARASISTVEFPVTAFQRMANVQVPTAAAMDAKWIDADAGGSPIPMLGPYKNAEPDTTRTLRVR
jgi:hypothetical protein